MNATTPPEYLTEPDDVATVIPTPWSQEAEQSVLGALLIDNRAFDRCADVLQERSFWHASHRTIWAAIAGQIMANKPADCLTVHDALQAAKQADDCGGLAYLNRLAESVVSAANVRRYAEIVAERCAQRDTIAAADKALTIAREPGPIGEKLDRIASEFAGVQREQMRNAPRQLAELVRAALDRYSDMAQGIRAPAWATGIGPLDGILNGGLRPGKLYCLAARPSVGKSSAARAIGLNLAFGGHPVLLLSQEMPGDEVADCAIAQLGGVEGNRLQTGQLAQSDWTGITTAADQVAGLPFYVEDPGQGPHGQGPAGAGGGLPAAVDQHAQGRQHQRPGGRDLEGAEAARPTDGHRGAGAVAAQPRGGEAGRPGTAAVGPARLGRHRAGHRRGRDAVDGARAQRRAPLGGLEGSEAPGRTQGPVRHVVRRAGVRLERGARRTAAAWRRARRLRQRRV